MNILVDSSVWIDYFRSGIKSNSLDTLIDQNTICTNSLILAEILPSLKVRKQSRLINLLYQIEKIELNINWGKIIDYQIICLGKGINKIGIPDLIVIDNVIQNNFTLYSLDNHFKLMNNQIEFDLYDN